MNSIEEVKAELNGDAGKWEEAIFHWACDIAQSKAKQFLEETDEELMRERQEELQVVGFRERCITTTFGDVKVQRRLYKDRDKNPRFLLDEHVGLEGGSRASPRVKELATFVCSYLPFRPSEQLLCAVLPQGISHTTIHRLVGKVVDPHIAREEEEVRELFEDGVVPDSEERVVPYLMTEADGTSIALQREKEKRTEVKVGIAYEGWEMESKDHYRLTGKMSYTGIMKGQRFWEGMSLNLAKKYDLPMIDKVIVGSDGAHWAKQGADILKGDFQLDRFHLRRALLQELKGDVDLANSVYQACARGEVALADSLLATAQDSAQVEDRKEIASLRGYLMDNAEGLADYRIGVSHDGLRGMGAIEGNVDKLVATRMKKRGMSWTKRGGDRMSRLINLRESGEIQSWIREAPHKINSPLRKSSEARTQTKHLPAGADDGAWLEVSMPCLHGPHLNRPWAQVLRQLSHQTHGRRQ
ncbi:MAG: ISLre2 family transposase [Dehalococcoidia bacterium]